MKSYNLSQCENPVIIRSRYTGEYLRVGCGCCRGCSLQRRDRMSLLCTQEEKKHKYCLFVTLTYNNSTVPLLQPLYKSHGLRNGYRFFNLCHRFKNLGSMVHFEPDIYHKSFKWITPFLYKLNMNGFIPFTTKRDAQLFLKRLRKYLSKYSNEKIKYYLCMEYGPVHFRPHFHLLLFFDEKKTKQYIGRCIRLAWSYRSKRFHKKSKKNVYKLRSFGRIDYSLTQGKAHSYVAGYVNSSCCLPRFYSYARFARPFVLHSKNFGDPLLSEQKEKIYEDENYGFTELSIQTNKKLSTYELQSTFKSRFFPKCRGFTCKSFPELYKTYTIYSAAKQYYKVDVVSKLSNLIWFDLHQCLDNYVINYFKSYLKCPDYRRFNMDPEHDRLFLQRIQSDLYASKHFVEFVCDNKSSLFHLRVSQIIKFWQHDDYSKLVKFYDSQIEFLSHYPHNGDYIPYMYNNFESYFASHFADYKGDLYTYNIYENFEHFCVNVFNHMFNSSYKINTKFRPVLKNHYMFNIIMADVSIRFNRSIKRKKQNDINNILNDL